MEQEYNIYCDFDIEKHKAVYKNYLEVVILPSGKIEYAIPSHQEKLINIGMKMYKKTRDEFINMCPREYYFNYLEWLCKVTRCVSIWTNGYVGEPNRIQKKKIEVLKKEGLLICQGK